MADSAATVFVVDDDEAVRDSLTLLLESYGIAVEAFGSTAELASRGRPDGPACLVLDQHLPGTTGLDFLCSPEGAALGLPVILVTGQGDLSIRTRALELGVAMYLDKPIDDGVLIGAIEQALAADRE